MMPLLLGDVLTLPHCQPPGPTSPVSGGRLGEDYKVSCMDEILFYCGGGLPLASLKMSMLARWAVLPARGRPLQLPARDWDTHTATTLLASLLCYQVRTYPRRSASQGGRRPCVVFRSGNWR